MGGGSGNTREEHSSGRCDQIGPVAWDGGVHRFSFIVRLGVSIATYPIIMLAPDIASWR